MIKFEFDAYKDDAARASAPEYLEAYKTAVRLAPTVPASVDCFVVDHKKSRRDIDDTILNFRVGTYTMGPTLSRCLLKKTVDPSKEELKNMNPEKGPIIPIRLSSYSVLKNLKHRNVVTAENFYDAFGVPTLVLSWVEGTLEAWLNSGGNKTKFFGTSVTRPSSWFRQLAVDFSSALEYLFDEGVYPAESSLENLYVCIVGTRVCLKILVCEEKLKVMFCKYFGKKTSMLEGYPDIWTNSKKYCYLLTIVASNADDMRTKLSNAKIAWPEAKSRDVNPLLRALVDHEMTKNITYDTSDPYDYLRLCRNVLKHWRVFFKEVDFLKRSCSCSDAFLQKMESWDRKFWFKLYEAIGRPEES